MDEGFARGLVVPSGDVSSLFVDGPGADAWKCGWLSKSCTHAHRHGRGACSASCVCFFALLFLLSSFSLIWFVRWFPHHLVQFDHVALSIKRDESLFGD